MVKDLYTEWLGIEPGPRPPDYYTLLGMEQFCHDADAIESGTRARLKRLDEFAMHPDRDKRDAVQDMMNEVAQARVCLINPVKRRAYDERLAAAIGVPVLAPVADGPAGPAPVVGAGVPTAAARPVPPAAKCARTKAAQAPTSSRNCKETRMPTRTSKTGSELFISDHVRHIIESKQFTDLANNPVFSTSDFRAVPRKYRTLIPEYVKDHISLNLNRFAA